MSNFYNKVYQWVLAPVQKLDSKRSQVCIPHESLLTYNTKWNETILHTCSESHHNRFLQESTKSLQCTIWKNARFSQRVHIQYKQDWKHWEQLNVHIWSRIDIIYIDLSGYYFYNTKYTVLYKLLYKNWIYIVFTTLTAKHSACGQ